MVAGLSDPRQLSDQPRCMTAQLFTENDTFCLLSTNMRCFCFILTLLLIISLTAAIANSMQTSKTLSASHCKENASDFGVGILCPMESMFAYYECCNPKPNEPKACCSQAKIWFLVAMIGVICSFIVGVGYSLVRYVSCLVCRC